MKGVKSMASAISALAFVLACDTALGQAAAPTETKGVSAKVDSSIELGAEIQGMSGRQLRTRTITFAPGAVFAVHTHKDRPETVVVVQGRLTEHRDGASKDYGPGEVLSATKETTHWLENKSSTPVVFIAVDIVPPAISSK